MHPPEFILSLVAMALFSGLVFSVIRTVGKAIERRQTGGRDIAELKAAVEALRAELAERQDDGVRLAELEERLDFAERLLAGQQPGQAKLPGAN